MKHLTLPALLLRINLLNISMCMFFSEISISNIQFYFLFNGTNTWNLVCDRSRLTAMAERTPTSAHGSLVFFNEQDVVEGKDPQWFGFSLAPQIGVF